MDKKKSHLLSFISLRYSRKNIDNLRKWQTLDIQPPLPEDVPPEPIK